ncbi:MAG: ABC transporter ATP-binding protein [Alphaproteobacteria bacterium]|nr:ABC transporter ATP-binding protein [Alphaproteobacteria bacterium]
MSPAPPLIEASSVTQIFAASDGEPSWALKNASLAVAPGEFVCIIGPSGCGKSTLLHMIAGFLTPTEGSLRFRGRPIEAPGPERGVVFQEYALFAWMTVRQNVEFGLKMRGIGKAERRDKARRFLDVVGLAKMADRYPHELSGGMRQRVAVARALVNEPEVLLMDEPFAAVDAITRATLQDELLRLWQEFRISVVFITHNIDEAIFLGERIVVMSAHPGTIRSEVRIDLPYPRDRGSAEFARLYARIGAELYGKGKETR